MRVLLIAAAVFAAAPAVAPAVAQTPAPTSLVLADAAKAPARPTISEATASWTSDQVMITIMDDGPGFSPEVIPKLGEPYISDRSEARLGGVQRNKGRALQRVVQAPGDLLSSALLSAVVCAVLVVHDKDIVVLVLPQRHGDGVGIQDQVVVHVDQPLAGCCWTTAMPCERNSFRNPASR